jgi:hypothetical protein
VAWLTRGDEVLAAVDTEPGGEGARVLHRPGIVHTFGRPHGFDVAWCTERDGTLEVRATTILKAGRLARPRPLSKVAVVAEEGAFERWRLVPGDRLSVAE